MFRLQLLLVPLFLLLSISRSVAAYNLEVPAEPWDEYRLQFKNYSKYLLASYDRAFVDDYVGAINEVEKAIELLPDEGIGFAERGKYHRTLNNTALAEKDFRTAISLFNQAIERYRPGQDKKSKKTAVRKVSPGDANRLIATLRFQRGEAFYNFEQYRQASEDFAAACQGGNSAACSRIWDIKAIEKRGIQWVPLSARQYYDRKSIKYISPSVTRVWVRREEPQLVQAESGADGYILQHLELNCSTREFALIVGLVVASDSQPMTLKLADSGFSKPVAGSAASRLMVMVCSARQQGR